MTWRHYFNFNGQARPKQIRVWSDQIILWASYGLCHLLTHPPLILTFLSCFSAPSGQICGYRILFDNTQSQEYKSDIGLAQWNAAMCTMTYFRTHSVSLVSGVQSRCVRPFFASTESQESKSDMNIARQSALRYI